jgi:hypothetical protein
MIMIRVELMLLVLLAFCALLTLERISKSLEKIARLFPEDRSKGITL